MTFNRMTFNFAQSLLLLGIFVSICQVAYASDETLYQLDEQFSDAFATPLATTIPVMPHPSSVQLSETVESLGDEPLLLESDLPAQATELDQTRQLESADETHPPLISYEMFSYIFPAEINSNQGQSTGNFSIFELDFYHVSTRSFDDSAPILSAAHQSWFRYREWTGVRSPDLPPNVYSFAFPFQLGVASVKHSGISFSLTPQFSSDFRANMNSDAWMFDIDLVGTRVINESFTLVSGVFYWDRVDAIVLPHAGFVFRPHEDWQFTMVFPHPTIDWKIYHAGDVSAWLKLGLEYHVESYQIKLAPADRDEQIQLADYRGTLGLFVSSPDIEAFFETGVVFDRRVKFRHDTPGFGISPALMLQCGFSY